MTYVNPEALRKLAVDLDGWRTQERQERDAAIRQQQSHTEQANRLRGCGGLRDDDPLFSGAGQAEGGSAMTRSLVFARLRVGGSRDGMPAEYLADYDRSKELWGG